MDVTPQVINEIEFHQKMRGYDPNEVDDFLERVAAAVGQLHERLQEAAARMMSAERRALELEARLKETGGQPAPVRAPAVAVAPPASGGASADEEADMIRRTLVLAQRTADAAIKEAEEMAQRTIQAATDQAEELYRESREQSRQTIEAAEEEAKRAGADTRQRLVAEVLALEQSRDALRADSNLLQRYFDEQRLRLRSSLAELQRVVDDPSRLRVAPQPAVSELSRPAAVADLMQARGQHAAPDADAVDAQDRDDAEPAADASSAPTSGDWAAVVGGAVPDSESFAPSPSPSPSPAPSDRGGFDREAFDRGAPITGGVTFTAADEAAPAAAEPEAPRGDEARPATTSPYEDQAWARFVGDDGPPTQAIGAVADRDADDDEAYLTDLNATIDDDPDPDRAFDAVQGDDSRRPRFGRRR